MVVVGLGSNVLASDEGVEALVVRLAGELASVEIDGTRLRVGGGAPNAVALHRARAAGLGGMEFACAIPGTAGGGVRMNPGAYGRDWSNIVERALVVTADGAAWLSCDDLELQYRHSALGPGQVVAQVEFRLDARDSAEIRSDVAALNARRKATQPINRRTFGSVFKNPDRARRGPHARRVWAEGTCRWRRAHLSATRELHRERGRRDGRGCHRPHG